MRRLRIITLPYLVWMVVLVLVPTLLILLLSVTNLDIYNIGPFSFVTEGFEELTKPLVITAMKNSVRLSLLATLICFLIGYPTAYFLANLKTSKKTMLITLFILPVWSNMLLRIIAWETLFFPNSILNMFGISLNLIGTDVAILIGMTSMYLPFMTLPLYSVLEKMDHSLIEASKDLGASNMQTFLKVTLPLSLSGVVSGVIMTLLPSMTAFALPERLSGGKTLLIGNIIEDYFMKTSNINGGAMISIALMVVIIVLFMVVVHFDKEGETLI
ncbi:MAG: ABC transporter permease [Candidatus Izemoplasmataceae bacterium]